MHHTFTTVFGWGKAGRGVLAKGKVRVKVRGQIYRHHTFVTTILGSCKGKEGITANGKVRVKVRGQK